MKISRFILPLLFAGVAGADDYRNLLNDGDGGVFAVADGETMVLENDNFSDCYATGMGGAIYVGADATLELKGSLEFANNVEYAFDDDGEWTGDANDIYLSEGATLILNAVEAGDVITLGSGVEAIDSAGTAIVVKKGAGTVNLGGAGDLTDYSFFEGHLVVEQGAMVVKTDVNALSASAESGASITVQGASCLNLVENFTNAISVAAREFDDETNTDASGTLTGTSVTMDGLRGGTLEDVSFTASSKVSEYAIADLVLMNSVLHLDGEGTELSNLTLFADSGITSAGVATLSGENYVILGDLNSSQLSGVTLEEGVVLTLGLTPDVLVAAGSTEFVLTFTGLEIAPEASVTIAAGGMTNCSAVLTVQSWTAVDGMVMVSMSAEYVPEPATATLSLLALCGLVARRRRQA